MRCLTNVISPRAVGFVAACTSGREDGQFWSRSATLRSLTLRPSAEDPNFKPDDKQSRDRIALAQMRKRCPLAEIVDETVIESGQSVQRSPEAHLRHSKQVLIDRLDL
jgi:hypothetical protein